MLGEPPKRRPFVFSFEFFMAALVGLGLMAFLVMLLSAATGYKLRPEADCSNVVIARAAEWNVPASTVFRR